MVITYIILTGMELFTVKDEVLKLTVKSGQVIKDKVLIQFKEDTIIFIPDYKSEEFKNRVKDSSLILVVEYRFEKVVPAPIAKIKLIEEHMVLVMWLMLELIYIIFLKYLMLIYKRGDI